ncbi:hypothetical protein KR215_004714, partial [Drosophila sulfurigaster]
VGVKWIYYRRRDELEALAQEFKFPVEGKVEDMRKAFASLIAKSRLGKKVWARLAELEIIYTRPRTPQPDAQATTSGLSQQFLQAPSVTLSKTETRTTSHVPVLSSTPATSSLHMPIPPALVSESQSNPIIANPSHGPYGTHLDRIRKWGIQFDGQGDPLAFVEALEERAQAYGISVDALPRSMAEGLVDRAARWFRTSGLSAVPWSEFRKEFLAFFLPTRYFE